MPENTVPSLPSLNVFTRCSSAAPTLSASLTVDAVAPADGPELGLEIIDDLDVDY